MDPASNAPMAPSPFPQHEQLHQALLAAGIPHNYLPNEIQTAEEHAPQLLQVLQRMGQTIHPPANGHTLTTPGKMAAAYDAGARAAFQRFKIALLPVPVPGAAPAKKKPRFSNHLGGEMAMHGMEMML